ncbi:hypothetical protein AARI_17690 [Glutamicibacter arilaitensis Re117]|uniref:Uncharacterized protein n=1 Tax=Glutamicibacter arilaitensis (strain DSM 16368 / CIP 108037 / IAM 15318 / JCM 13566 / NCIMB 14258 / Re117) TaxID=861360 RepID=A0ABP1U5A9_GLUAR|nr:hypothetical protein AARI_17690 [Glutamicibacter arilaitensis Re117]
MRARYSQGNSDRGREAESDLPRLAAAQGSVRKPGGTLHSKTLAWARYEERWLKANSVRAISSAAGATLLLAGT